ncbi:hypothetical protein NC651_028509 [Populus alba x Populus x berolinensis]|nr:hypothetical protein NC651_028509 [Populus alba x Populus x berolinensis]
MAASFLGRECNNGTILWSPSSSTIKSQNAIDAFSRCI